MVVSYGRLDEFDNSKEEWNSYVERLEFYFVANNIKDESDDDKKKRRAERAHTS